MVVKYRLFLMITLVASTGTVQAAPKSKGVVIDCVSTTDPVTRTSTNEMLDWLSSYNAAWNPDDGFSIGGVGAIGRLFAPNGRLIHPTELAGVISSSPSFSGKKKKQVWLGVSDSDAGGESSYSTQLSKLLNVKVSGCPADAYFMQSGSMMCGSKPVFVLESGKDIGRIMPAGYSMGEAGFMMLFCSNGNEAAINPKKVLTTSVVYGLFEDEKASLSSQAEHDSLAAFRLYQYYWLSARKPKTALTWLEKAAASGLDVAKFNLAYELFVAGGAENEARAEELSAELVAKGYSGPDLRTVFVGK